MTDSVEDVEVNFLLELKGAFSVLRIDITAFIVTLKAFKILSVKA